MRGYVLVGGWPGSGKTTTARLLAQRLGCAYLAKDEVKEALMDELGAPATLEPSRWLGRAAVAVVLRVAQGCPAAVIDSTWFDYTVPMLGLLSGPKVELRCVAPLRLVRERYHGRVRDPRHLDADRTEDELWGRPVAPLGVGPLIEVDTTRRLDADALADRVSAALAAQRP
ncbi:MAG: AAA family ATPase [Micropruina sp.]|nr:AAA family ATPase [Micropruina sp.]